eukprot:TRINITY_DN8105_c0_g1_i1.p1 TRINITY_DN8105_c0_g1~~TRINITY_DN8105_c0_g1_i1.p1  ORF type:complete len:485 (+),score=140.52 TRINITY_DN8105_c0_g1_i1:91-1545(+)
MGTATVALLVAAVTATARVAVVSVVGALCARFPKNRPLLHPRVREDIGRLGLRVLVPSLFLSAVGATLHAEVARRVWPLLLWCIFSILISAVLAAGAARCIGLGGWRLRVFVVAGAFQNGVSLPMLMLDTLCEAVPELAADYGDPAECREASYALTLLYNIPWRIMIFGFVQPWFARNGEGLAAAAASAAGGGKQRYAQLDDPPPPRAPGSPPAPAGAASPAEEMAEFPLAMAVADVAPPMTPSDGPASPASPEAPPQLEPAAAARWQAGTRRRHCLRRLRHAGRHALAICKDPNIAVIPVALTISLIDPVRGALFGSLDKGHPISFIGSALRTLSQPLVPLTVLICAAAMVPPPVHAAADGEPAPERPGPGGPQPEPVRCSCAAGFWTESAALSFVRLVLSPAAVCACAYALQTTGLLQLYPLEWLLIYIEAAAPSAQLPVVLLTTQGQHAMAGRLSRMYICEYLVAAFSMTAFVTLGLHLVA